jgi:SAM-dependent methyltransferase
MSSFRRRPVQPRTPASFDDADAGLLDVLAELEGTENYTNWVLSLCSPHLAGAILEVGAGQGTYTEQLSEHGKVTALEPSNAQADRLRRRLGGSATICVVHGDLSAIDPGTRFDSVVLINVLEHIPDDVDALSAIAARLNPGGRLILWVPAFECLYGPFDRQIGHYRRYRRRQLIRRVEASGLRVTTSHYCNLPGFFAWALVVRLLKQRPTSGRLANVYDRAVVPAVRRVEGVVRPPFGQSVFLVAIKDEPSR